MTTTDDTKPPANPNPNNNRAPAVTYGSGSFGSPDVVMKPAARGDNDREIKICWHAEPAKGLPAARCMINVRRLADGTPVVEVFQSDAGVKYRVPPSAIGAKFILVCDGCGEEIREDGQRITESGPSCPECDRAAEDQRRASRWQLPAATTAEVDDPDPYEGSWREAADNEGARIAADDREHGEDE